MSDTNTKLTAKQECFVLAYLANGFNATEAAKSAGYAAGSAHVTGARLLKNAKVVAFIREQMSEYAMSAEEALLRLSEIAKSTMADFVNSENGTLDLAKAERNHKLHLIKRFTHTSGEKSESRGIELYDAQAALLAILKEARLDDGKPTDNLGVVNVNFTVKNREPEL